MKQNCPLENRKTMARSPKSTAKELSCVTSFLGTMICAHLKYEGDYNDVDSQGW
jgi:hypothetical protein